MSLRQRHIDPQLAIGSQRLVDSCLLSGQQQQQGEGTPLLPRSSAAFRHSRSQSFGQLDSLPQSPLSPADPQPYGLKPQPLSSLSSSCLPCSVGGALGHHSAHTHHPHHHHHHLSFQPLDPIPDFTFSDDSHAHPSRRDSSGYLFCFPSPLTSHVDFYSLTSVTFGPNAPSLFLFLQIQISSSCR